MKEAKITKKLLAVMAGIAVYYFLNLGLDRLAMEYVPVETGMSVDMFLARMGFRPPIPSIFTVTKLVSALSAGAVGGFMLKERALVLLTLPVLIVEAPLFYVAFGEGAWLLVFKMLLTSTIPAVIFCMLGVWLTAREER